MRCLPKLERMPCVANLLFMLLEVVASATLRTRICER